MRAQQRLPWARLDRNCKTRCAEGAKARILCLPPRFVSIGNVFISLSLGFPICKGKLIIVVTRFSRRRRVGPWHRAWLALSDNDASRCCHFLHSLGELGEPLAEVHGLFAAPSWPELERSGVVEARR